MNIHTETHTTALGILMKLKAEILTFLCFTLPIRFAFANDCKDHALFCDDIANDHYGHSPCKWFRFKLAIRNFVEGLFVDEVPQYFLDRWFGKS